MCVLFNAVPEIAICHCTMWLLMSGLFKEFYYLLCRLIPFNTADKRLSVSARPPAPLPRSLASLDTDKLLPISPNSIAMSPSKSDSQILNYQQNGGMIFVFLCRCKMPRLCILDVSYKTNSEQFYM